MRTRTLLFAALIAACITILAETYLTASATEGTRVRTTDTQRSEIRYQHLDNPKWTHDEVERTIRSAVRRWPVPGGASFAISTARCESGLEAHAYNSGGYAGVFQQSTRYWPARQNQYDSRRWHLGESPYNARSNVIVSIRMAHSAGWGAWSCA